MKTKLSILAVILVIVLVFLGLRMTNQRSSISPGLQLASVIPITNLEGHWTLDGNVNDSVSGGSNGSAVGTTTWPQGKIGSSAQLDGTNYLSIPGTSDLQPTGSYTYSLWLNLVSAGSQDAWAGIVMKTTDGTAPNLSIQLDGAKNVIVQHNSTTTIQTGISAADLDDSWNLLTITYDAQSKTLKSYLNGSGDAVATNTGIDPVTGTGDGALYIGREESASPVGGYKIKGLIDDVLFYSKALPREEVTNIYNAANQTTTNNTITLFVYYGGDVAATGATFTCGAYNNGATAGSYKICSASVAEDTEITLTETTQTNFTFSGWTGSLQSSCVMLEQTCIITVPAVTVPVTYPTITANFTALTTNPRGPVFFKPLTATPNIVNGEQRTKLTWTTKLATSCTLTGDTPSPKSVGTSNNNYQTAALTTHPTNFSLTCKGATGTPDATSSVQVTVKPIIKVTKNLIGTGAAGTITGVVTGTTTPKIIDCGSTCTSAPLTAGTSVTLTATPDANSTFDGWTNITGCTTPTANTVRCDNLTANRTITATFTRDVVNEAPVVTVFTLPTTPNPYNSTTVPVTITATDETGVTSYQITESSTPPTTTGWTAITDATPTSITVSTNINNVTNGTHTFYAWVRDAEGLVSARTTISTKSITVSVVSGTNWYVRQNGPITSQSATGGDSWTNAFSMAGLNANWSRVQPGNVVCLAGTVAATPYTQYMNVGKSGNTTDGRIVIKKATAGDAQCGSGIAGWQASYANQAVIDAGDTGIMIDFKNNITVDGGPEVAGAGGYKYGIKIFYDPIAAHRHAGISLGTVGSTSSNITLQNIELEGPGENYEYSFCRSWDWNGAMGVSAQGAHSNVKLSHMSVHDSDTLLQLNNVTDLTVEYSELYNSGANLDRRADTSHDCHPNVAYLASDKNVVFRYNDVHHFDGTGFYPSGNYTSTNQSKIYGNYFHDTTSAGSRSIWFNWDITSSGSDGTWSIYNNTFKNLAQSSICSNSSCDSGTANPSGDVKNNIFYTYTAPNSYGAMTHTYNFYSGTNLDTTGGVGNGANPFSSGATLNTGVPGTPLVAEYNKDPNNVTRGDTIANGGDGVWDMGTYEYTGGGSSSGSILIKRVGADFGTSSSPAGAVSRIDGGTTTASNPATFSSLSTTTHTVSATDVANYTESFGICTYPQGGTECSMPTSASYGTAGMTCTAGFCTVSTTVAANTTSKVVFKYDPVVTSFTVSLTKAGAGASTSSLSSVPTGLTCATGTACTTTPVSATFSTPVTITAVPGSGYQTAWSGCGTTTSGNTCTITSAASVVATFSTSVGCTGTCKYIRSGILVGGNGDSWDTAYKTFPSTYLRGTTYYVASGNYAGAAISTPLSGIDRIVIKKATDSDHGSSTGWTNSNTAFGLGKAVFSNDVNISTGFVTLDGQSEHVPYGFEFVVQDTVGTGSGETGIFIGENGQSVVDGITLRYLDIHGVHGDVPWNFLKDVRGIEIRPWNGTAYVPIRNLTIEYSNLHAVSTLIQINQTSSVTPNNITVQYNKLHDTLAADGYNSATMAHQNVFYIENSRGITFRYNEVYRTTATGYYPTNSNGHEIYGNVFRDIPGSSSYVIWINSGGQTGVQIYNNTFVNVGSNAYISYGTSSGTASNNLFYGTTIPGWGGLASSNNVTATAGQFVDLAGGDYHLTGAIPGVALSAPYNKDKDGVTRGSIGAWDIGAYEFTQ